MTFTDKIEEWIKEAETRPGSALLILQLVAGRLRDLTQRNDELLAENIALQNGTRVEEYQKRITHLEYQLGLLKRKFLAADDLPAGTILQQDRTDLLIYNAQGRIFRLHLENDLASLGRLEGELAEGGELPRFQAMPSNEDILLLFSSGRVATQSLDAISPVSTGGSWHWDQATLPDEPHAGELLVCLMPLSRLPVSEFILQASRRGVVKKTLRSISEKVLADHYLGRAAAQKSDQPFDVCLADKKARYALVTYEGRLVGLDVDDLSYAAEERIRLGSLDHLIAAFNIASDESILCLTQNGKIVLREAAGLEITKSATARGQALIPQARLDQGTRFIGAVPFRPGDRLIVLDGQGRLNLYSAADMAGAGAILKGGICVALGRIPFAPAEKTTP